MGRQTVQDRPIQGQCYACSEFNYKWFVNDVENPYTQYDGDDWPLTYDELVPYYELVEKFVGISGKAENLPQLPDSVSSRRWNSLAAKRSCGNRRVKKWAAWSRWGAEDWPAYDAHGRGRGQGHHQGWQGGGHRLYRQPIARHSG